MSLKVMTWVFDRSRSTGNSRLVLLALADHCDDETWTCWPSLKRIAEKAKVSTRTAQRCLAALEELGEIDITAGAGESRDPRYRTNRYRILAKGRQVVTPPSGATSVTPATDPGVTDPTSRGDRSRDPGVTLVSYEPSPEPSVEPSAEKTPQPPFGRPGPRAKTTRTRRRDPRPNEELARLLIVEWWEDRKQAGRPVHQPFMACVATLERMLDGGLDEADAWWCLRNALVVSGASFDIALNRRHNPLADMVASSDPDWLEAKRATEPPEQRIRRLEHVARARGDAMAGVDATEDEIRGELRVELADLAEAAGVRSALNQLTDAGLEAWHAGRTRIFGQPA